MASVTDVAKIKKEGPFTGVEEFELSPSLTEHKVRVEITNGEVSEFDVHFRTPDYDDYEVEEDATAHRITTSGIFESGPSDSLRITPTNLSAEYCVSIFSW